MNPVLLGGARLLAAGTDDKDRGNPIGLFVILVLCIAVYFLWKSLNRHLKRVPPSFDPPVDGVGSDDLEGVTLHGADATVSPGTQASAPAEPNRAAGTTSAARSVGHDGDADK